MIRYALSKICGEKTARTFSRRFKNDIYALRIGNVIEPHEYARDFPAFIENPATRKRNAWSYIDARDLGQICDLAIAKSGMFFPFWSDSFFSGVGRFSGQVVPQVAKVAHGKSGMERQELTSARAWISGV